MIVLDTNVVSALMVPALNPGAVAWLDRQSADLLWIVSISVLEIRSGLLRLPDGKRQREMTSAFETMLKRLLAKRVLPFDYAAAEAAATIAAKRIKAGLNIETLDTQIAGICFSRRASLATRNVRHFADLDLQLVNPWAG